MSGQIQVTTENRLAVVIISQPARRNAITQLMAKRLKEIFVDLSRDDNVGCVVLKGDGPLAFCAGADITEFGEQRGDPDIARVFDDIIQGAADAIGQCRHPVIAQISGACVGGGLQLAMQCDIRICVNSSRFGIPVNRLGLAAAWGELAPLVQIVGAAVTFELLLEGSIIDATRAVSIGLVNRVVPDDELPDEVARAAQRILAGAPLVSRWHKQFIRRLMDPSKLSDAEMADAYACFGTADYREGYSSFIAKRTPHFVGR